MEPTLTIRAVTYERDGHRCVSCGATTGLQYQHRQATGMGGSKVRPRIEQGVTSCGVCNPEYERGLQTRALVMGWKVPRWVKRPDLVPLFSVWERSWWLLGVDGSRSRVSGRLARKLMVEVYGQRYEEWEQAA